jgi:hypothetical protein
MKKYFETPRRVVFWQDAKTMCENNTDCFMGIAYHDEIICPKCGGIVKISEVKKIKILPWTDITDVILLVNKSKKA